MITDISRDNMTDIIEYLTIQDITKIKILKKEYSNILNNYIYKKLIERDYPSKSKLIDKHKQDKQDKQDKEGYEEKYRKKTIRLLEREKWYKQIEGKGIHIDEAGKYILRIIQKEKGNAKEIIEEILKLYDKQKKSHISNQIISQIFDYKNLRKAYCSIYRNRGEEQPWFFIRLHFNNLVYQLLNHNLRSFVIRDLSSVLRDIFILLSTDVISRLSTHLEEYFPVLGILVNLDDVHLDLLVTDLFSSSNNKELLRCVAFILSLDSNIISQIWSADLFWSQYKDLILSRYSTYNMPNILVIYQ